MTLPLGNRTDATGSNTTADYDYTFRIIDETDLVVTVIALDGTETTLDLTDDYTVDGVGDVGGGEIHLVDDGQAWLDDDGYLDADYDIVIRRVRPLTQQTDIRNQGDFYPEAHEDAFDHFMMIAQQMQEQLDRCVQSGVGATPPDLEDINNAVDAAEAAQTAAEVAQGLSEDARDAAVIAKNAAELAAAILTAASQAEAEAGSDNTKYMTALRVLQSINANKVRVGTGTISTGALAINAALLDVVNVTVDDDFTLNIPSNGQAGQRVTVRLTQDGTGNHAITLHENFLIASELATDGVVLSTAAGAIDKIGLYCVDGSTWEVEAFSTDFAVQA